MLQHFGRQLKDAALHFHRRAILGLETLRHVIVRAPRVDFGAAGVNVDGSKIVFRPGVDREVRFGDDDDAGDAVRVEGVEHDVHDVRARMLGRVHHDAFNFMYIV